MATKITDLTSLGAVPADSDVIPIVDVSDTSQAASGTAKKLTATYLVKSDGTSTQVTGGGIIALGGYTLTVGATGTASLAGHAHATTDITSGTMADARIAESNVTQHEAALTITESQISDLGTYLTTVALDDVSDVTITTPADNEVLAYNGAGAWINQTAAEAGLAAASHTHTESEITDLGSYAAATHTHTESDITDLGSYEPALGNPASDGYVLSSTAAGTRSWVATSSGPDEYVYMIDGEQHDNNTTSYLWGGESGTTKYLYYTDAMVPTGYSVYFQIHLAAAPAQTAYAILYTQAGASVAASEVTHNTTTSTIVESSALTLTDDTLYRMALKSSSASNARAFAPRLIIRRD